MVISGTRMGQTHCVEVPYNPKQQPRVQKLPEDFFLADPTQPTQESRKKLVI